MFLINPYIYSTTAWENLKSISFDGVDESLDCGSPTELSATQHFSFSCWVKLSSLAAFNYPWAFINTEGAVYCAITTAGRVQWYMNNPTSNISYTVDGKVVVNTWTNLVFVYDGTLGTNNLKAKIYVNGVSSASLSSGTIPTTRTFTDSSNFGGFPSGADMVGNLDEIALFDYSLSASEVTTLYNSGCPNDLLNQSFTSPTHLWRVDGSTYPTINDIGTVGGLNGTMTNQESGDIQTDTPC